MLPPFKPHVSTWGFFILLFMKRINYFKFLENMDKIREQVEEKQKKEAIGRIVNSLQRPFQDLMKSLKNDLQIENLRRQHKLHLPGDQTSNQSTCKGTGQSGGSELFREFRISR